MRPKAPLKEFTEKGRGTKWEDTGPYLSELWVCNRHFFLCWTAGEELLLLFFLKNKHTGEQSFQFYLLFLSPEKQTDERSNFISFFLLKNKHTGEQSFQFYLLSPEKQTHWWTIIPILSPSFSWKTNRWAFKCYLLLLSPEKQTDEQSFKFYLHLLSPKITNKWKAIQYFVLSFSWETNHHTMEAIIIKRLNSLSPTRLTFLSHPTA